MSVAQPDRVSDSDSEGHGFESRRAYHGCTINLIYAKNRRITAVFAYKEFAKFYEKIGFEERMCEWDVLLLIMLFFLE